MSLSSVGPVPPNQLGALVTELVALSPLQGAERLPELGTISVDHIVRQALERCRLAAESANIRITAVPAQRGRQRLGCSQAQSTEL
jgi:hypothetical protein